MKQDMRQLPPIHELQKDRRFEVIRQSFNLTIDQMTKFIQQAVRDLRESLLNDGQFLPNSDPDISEMIFEQVAKTAGYWKEDRLAHVINGTGTVLHTNLGRSRLSSKAAEHVTRVAQNYSNLEFRVAQGKRGSRHDIIEDLLKETTGAEAAMVVNNNAAAVFLILSALARAREVIVSRGQLVEIGGSFRISSIMEESGAHLIEVGTTNKTHLTDFQQAINEETSIIMKVHTSNFMMIGFTETVKTEALVKLKNQHEGLLLYEDLGSGALYDFKKHGIGDEPVVKEVVESGVDIVSFSGDKLLGGPQAGIIAGRKDIIDQLKQHQLARVLRVDKMTLAALEETLKTYVTGGDAVLELPTLRDISRSPTGIKQQAEDFIRDVQSRTSAYNLHLQKSTSRIGGGTMPGVELPTYVAAIVHFSLSAQKLAAKLRSCSPAIVTRIQDNQVYVDFRTIEKQEMQSLVDSFAEIAQEK